MRNYNNPHELEHPEDQQRGRIVAGVYLVAILILLFLPWFTTEYPLPEPGGLMASFGNVEIAGGSEDFVQEQPTPEQPQEQPVEQPVEEPVEEPVEDIESETVNTPDAPTVSETKPEPKPEVQPTPPKPAPRPKVNQNALFPGSSNTNGQGSGSGDGRQGTPTGRNELGGTGNGSQGLGNGQGLGQRRIISRCTDYNNYKGNWTEKATVIVDVCIDARGKVSQSRVNRRKSTTNNKNLLDLALGCAQQYKYERAPGQPDACGEITIYFDKK